MIGSRRIEPVENRTLRDRATDALRDAITHGVLKPGQRLGERELAAELDVSRLPIREAIQQLEYEGLLVSIPRKGTFVVEITDDDVVEIFSLRTAFESLAIRLVTESATLAQIARLQSYVDEMGDASARQDYPALWDVDIDFHTTLCTIAGHGRLLKHWSLLFQQWRALDALVDQIQPLMELGSDHPLVIDQGLFPTIHQDLVGAIAAGDPDAAAESMRRHMDHALRNTLAVKALADQQRAQLEVTLRS